MKQCSETKSQNLANDWEAPINLAKEIRWSKDDSPRGWIDKEWAVGFEKI